MSILGRALAYVVLAVALVAAAVALNDGKHPVEDAAKREVSAAKNDLDAELARCKAIGLEADAACKAVWEANRNRFFRSAKADQSRLTDTVTTASKAAAAPAQMEPDHSRRSTTTQNPLGGPGDTMGRPK
ncbi:MAG: putative entry exclusion protein TrbK-alt [Vicinamibacterales bacterium]